MNPSVPVTRPSPIRWRFITYAIVLIGAILAFERESESIDSLTRSEFKPLQAGHLLRTWTENGTAAGNNGDFYENYDEGRSVLDISRYPQLQPIVHPMPPGSGSPRFGMQLDIRPGVVFGNSSTSDSPEHFGRNPHSGYQQLSVLQQLAQQYRANNLYIYTENCDQGPENASGLADTYFTNTPYIFIVKGFSDQSFIQTIPFVLAAFRPEVKSKLIQNGLVMPTLQMLFRTHNKIVRVPSDYLTGIAHPTVWDGNKIDQERLVNAAHRILPSDIPPLARLSMKRSEPTDPTFAGIEIWVRAESVIAKNYDSPKSHREITVSAEDSFDINNRPLSFHWVVLRGDPSLVEIKPLNSQKSRAEIVIRYHPRTPITSGQPMDSCRIDIGVFVHNGIYYSAPAFITSRTIDSEAQTYSGDGRLVEIGYGPARFKFEVTDWRMFFASMQNPASEVAAIVREAIPPKERAQLMQAADEYRIASKRLDDAGAASESVRKENTPENQKGLMAGRDKAASEKVANLTSELDHILDAKPRDCEYSIRTLAPWLLFQLAHRSDLYPQNQVAFTSLPSRAAKLLEKMKASRLLKLTSAGFEWLAPSALSESEFFETPSVPLPTEYQKRMCTLFHAELLAGSLGGLSVVQRLKLPPEMAADPQFDPRDWRDVYRYHRNGAPMGWIQIAPDGSTVELSQHGHVVKSRDALGRCISALHLTDCPPGSVKMRTETPVMKPGHGLLPMREFHAKPGLQYRYRDDLDFVGRAIPN